MLQTVIYGLIWCFAVYGILVMIQEITKNKNYRKIEEKTQLILTVKDAQDGIENYIREIACGRNLYSNLIVIDLDSCDETFYILKRLEKENINMKVLTKDEGKSYFKKMAV